MQGGLRGPMPCHHVEFPHGHREQNGLVRHLNTACSQYIASDAGGRSNTYTRNPDTVVPCGKYFREADFKVPYRGDVFCGFGANGWMSGLTNTRLRYSGLTGYLGHLVYSESERRG